MKKFCVSILLVLSLLMTPLFAVACEAIDAPTHNISNGKTSPDKDGKMQMNHCCCHQHTQADRFIHKETLSVLTTTNSSFPLPNHTFSRSIITGPLLEPPSA